MHVRNVDLLDIFKSIDQFEERKLEAAYEFIEIDTGGYILLKVDWREHVSVHHKRHIPVHFSMLI